MEITTDLVRKLLHEQFPAWESYPLLFINEGWDNRTFRLGDTLSVRLPSHHDYAQQVTKEFCWLKKLAPTLPLAIPQPIALGIPSSLFPYHWGVYKWLPGTSASHCSFDQNNFATTLGLFLKALHNIDTTNGPVSSIHNFYRGAHLQIYSDQTLAALDNLNSPHRNLFTTIWHSALATHWQNNPVWIHGDISPGNLLIHNDQLAAVIDFGLLAVGDPACDLAIAWNFLNPEARALFKATLTLDHAAWLRGQAWALWKALITLKEHSDTTKREHALQALHCIAQYPEV